jgi:alcohol dehydrogenase YqhD (iron-dependent ADH family)
MAPVGTIHTIAAAGSETSVSSVIVDDLEHGNKHGFMWDPCRPVFAIMNPELTYSVPYFQTGAGSADIFAHTLMRYFVNSDSNLGDEYAEGTLRSVVKYASIALANPRDYEARAELMLAGSFSHNGLTGIGRSGPQAGEHGLEAQLSGHYDTAHGAGLATVMPPMLKYFVEHGTPKQAARVAQFGVKVFGAPADLTEIKATAYDGIDRFRGWIKSIGMPLTLKELGVPKGDLPEVIRRCVEATGGVIHGYLDLDKKAITEIFTSIVE